MRKGLEKLYEHYDINGNVFYSEQNIEDGSDIYNIPLYDINGDEITGYNQFLINDEFVFIHESDFKTNTDGVVYAILDERSIYLIDDEIQLTFEEDSNGNVYYSSSKKAPDGAGYIYEYYNLFLNPVDSPEESKFYVYEDYVSGKQLYSTTRIEQGEDMSDIELVDIYGNNYTNRYNQYLIDDQFAFIKYDDIYDHDTYGSYIKVDSPEKNRHSLYFLDSGIELYSTKGPKGEDLYYQISDPDSFYDTRGEDGFIMYDKNLNRIEHIILNPDDLGNSHVENDRGVFLKKTSVSLSSLSAIGGFLNYSGKLLNHIHEARNAIVTTTLMVAMLGTGIYASLNNETKNPSYHSVDNEKHINDGYRYSSNDLTTKKEYEDFLMDLSHQYQLPSKILSAIWMQESSGLKPSHKDAPLVSSKNAIGPFQIRENTAKWVGNTKSDLNDFQKSANIAAKVLSKLYNIGKTKCPYLDDDALTAFVLASYNAGSTNALEWAKEAKKISPHNKVDYYTYAKVIDFGETRRYVENTSHIVRGDGVFVGNGDYNLSRIAQRLIPTDTSNSKKLETHVAKLLKLLNPNLDKELKIGEVVKTYNPDVLSIVQHKGAIRYKIHEGDTVYGLIRTFNGLGVNIDMNDIVFMPKNGKTYSNLDKIKPGDILYIRLNHNELSRIHNIFNILQNNTEKNTYKINSKYKNS